MDTKVTLSFDKTVAEKAKRFAEKNNVSLSRLVEYLLDRVTSANQAAFEEFPVSDWVNQVAEGSISYQTKRRSRETLKKEFYKGKR